MKSSLFDQPNSYPPWAPRIWTGLKPGDYWRFLSENKFRIHPLRYAMTGLISFWSIGNLALSPVQNLIHGSKIVETELVEPPIFILGHWRSGTTLLHELMSLDEDLAFPTNYDAFLPYHFMVSGPLFRPLMRLLMPGKRPMDSMSMHVDSPQEDDFALLLMGAPVQYRRMGFPQHDNDYERFLDWQQLEPQELADVEYKLKFFYQALTYKYKKRLALKSPPHTGRIECLAKWFPGAKFIHISRHPHEVVPSTMRLWKLIDDVHAFQVPRYDEAELLQYVNRCHEILYRPYHQSVANLRDNQLAEVRFEDLVAKPRSTINHIYEKLELDGSDRAVESAESYFAQRKNHKRNRYDIDNLIAPINTDWSEYMERFGYQGDSTSGANG